MALESSQALAAENVENTPTVCPHCQSLDFVHNGSSRGRKRYLCHTCGRTFGQKATPNTPAVRLKQKYKKFITMCQEPRSLRDLSTALKVSVSTAFRWRQRYLEQLEEVDKQPALADQALGISFSQITTSSAQSSSKAAPAMARYPALPSLDQGVPVLAAAHAVSFSQDRVISLHTSCYAGRVVPTVVSSSPEELERTLNTKEGSDLVAISIAARQRGALNLGREAGRPMSSHWSECHQARRACQTVALLFKRWMRQFRGVALANVRRYIAWFNVYCQEMVKHHRLDEAVNQPLCTPLVS